MPRTTISFETTLAELQSIINLQLHFTATSTATYRIKTLMKEKIRTLNLSMHNNPSVTSSTTNLPALGILYRDLKPLMRTDTEHVLGQSEKKLEAIVNHQIKRVENALSSKGSEYNPTRDYLPLLKAIMESRRTFLSTSMQIDIKRTNKVIERLVECLWEKAKAENIVGC